MEGIYRIYMHRFDENNAVHRRMVGRIWIEQGQLRILEDHRGELHRLFPEGPLTPKTQQRLVTLPRSGYYDVVPEADIEEGHHPDDVASLDIGEITPDGIFTLTGDGMVMPQLVEVYENAIVLAGKKLSDMEARDLMDKVSVGKLVLTPAE